MKIFPKIVFLVRILQLLEPINLIRIYSYGNKSLGYRQFGIMLIVFGWAFNENRFYLYHARKTEINLKLIIIIIKLTIKRS